MFSQLGLPQFPRTAHGNIPFPVELHLPGVHVVSLAAGHWSVQILLLILHILLSCIQTGLSMHLVLMVVCMSGVGILIPSVLC